jgi:predicted DNA-binding protein
MAITDDLRKTLSDPTPLYFAAGTADLAFQQARKVPVLVEQLRAEAPARIEAVRNTDPKAVQEKATARVKETQGTLQAKANELFGNLDADFKKLGETAQDLALRSVGVAAEYAVRARETYEKVAERGEHAVRTWRGQAAEGIEDVAEEVEELAIAVEPTKPAKTAKAEPVEVTEEKSAAAGKTPAPRKAPAKKSTTGTAKKTTPPAK